MKAFCQILFLPLLVGFPFLAEAQLMPVGLPFDGPTTVPGVVQAENFNLGQERGPYFANTPGNQGDSAYRIDAPDVDIREQGGLRWLSFSDPGGYVQPEWFNYTVRASEEGWFALTARVRTSQPLRFSSLLNDRGLGDSRWIDAPEFQEVLLVDRMRLTEGIHTLKIVKRIPIGFLEVDWLRVAPTGAPTLEPRMVSSGGDRFVALADASQPPFSADATGTFNAAPAINAAMEEVRSVGGGVVYLPEGRYRLNSPLYVPGHVTLLGADRGDGVPATLLMNGRPPSASDQEAYDAPGLIQLAETRVAEGNSSLRNISVWYPEQDPLNVKMYPFAVVSLRGHSCHISGITLYGAYNGIRFDRSSAIRIDRIRGTALRRGLQSGLGLEYSQFTKIEFSNDVWAEAPPEIITNAPQSPSLRRALDHFTTENLEGIRIGENDGYQYYGITVRDALRPISIGMLPGDNDEFYGILSKIEGEVFDLEPSHRIPGVLHYEQTDDVPETAPYIYEFAQPPRPARTDPTSLISVLDFGANGTGEQDDTQAVQAALDAAGAAGGGTVFLPPGQYRIEGRLNVPTGVELRGPLGTMHLGFLNEPCLVTAHIDRGTDAPQTAPAFITLQPNSGLRGFRIAYPEQGVGVDRLPVVPYPFTVRGMGAGAWLWDMHFSAAYNVADFATHDCDEAIVANTWGHALNLGFDFGGGAQGIRVERSQVSYGGGNINRLNQNSPELQGAFDEYITFTRRNVDAAYRFGATQHAATFAANSWEVVSNMVFREQDGHGSQSGFFWHNGGEASLEASIDLHHGDDLHFIGASRGGGIENQPGDDYSWLRTTETFGGRAFGYAPMLWGQQPGPDLDLHELQDYREFDIHTLAADAVTTASSQLNENSGPERAIDRNPFSKWTANDPELWLDLKFGQPVEIDRWVVRNAHSNPFDSIDFNTAAGALLVSEDGTDYEEIDAFANNTRHAVDLGPAPADDPREFPRRTRYARLDVLQPGQNPDQQTARIPELRIHGRAGWHFRADGEGWTPLGPVRDIRYENDRVYFTSTDVDPIFVTGPDLRIPLDRFDRIHVRMKNLAPRTRVQLFFSTESDRLFDEEKSLSLPHYTEQDGAYRDYIFNFSQHPQWKGVLHRLRLDPGSAPGDYAIESIAMVPDSRRQLTIDAQGGRVQRSLQRLLYVDGTRLRLQAIPDAGFQFMGWEGGIGGASSAGNPIFVTLDTDLHVKAVFKRFEEMWTLF